MDVLPALTETVLKIATAFVLGGIIGWERESLDRPAGLRTHVLVCVGSAAYMIVSMSFPSGRSDPGRIAAQVATGMGFLGAGTIIRQGSVVRGLTTAATLWAVAAIGLCAGRGGVGYVVGISTAFFVVFALRGLSWVEKVLVNKRQYRQATLQLRSARRTLARLHPLFEQLGVGIKSFQVDGSDRGESQEVRLVLRLPPGIETDQLTTALCSLEEVLSLEWD